MRGPLRGGVPTPSPLVMSRRGFVAALCAVLHQPTPLHALGAFGVRFYTDVTRDTCLELRTAMEEQVTERARWAALARSPIDADALPPIELSVSSHGGSLLDAFQMYDYLSHIPVLHTHVEGLVASAATLFTVVGSHRTMTRHSMMLVHQPSQPTAEGAWKADDLRDEWVNMQKSQAALVRIYGAHTLLSADEITELLQNEQMLTAVECLQYGFIDDIV